MNKVGAVTVTYNSARVIDGFMKSLLAQEHTDFVVYLIDNASADNTLQRIAAYPDPRIEVIANRDNLGFAAATNQGITRALEAGCDSILLVNNDTEFDGSLLRELVISLDRHDCDVVVPKILFYDDPQLIWSAGGGFNWRRGYSAFHHGYGEIDRGQFDEPKAIEHAPGCCLLARREVFEQIGKLDDRYFTYVEDTDFSFRAGRAGLKLLYVPSARLLHKAHSLTGGLFSKFMMRYTTRNRVYFLLKHFGVLRGMLYIPAYQLHLLLQLVLGKSSVGMFWLREKAMLEGLRLWRQSLAEQR